MQSLQENIIVDLILQNTKKINLVNELKGFENVKDYILSINPKETPLIWLTAQHNEKISLLTLDPFLVCLDYQPEFHDKDLDLLNIQAVEELLVLCIVYIGQKHAPSLTVNLKAPLVINWTTGMGKQIIIQNHQNYSLEHCLYPHRLKAA